jgi:hypothetical protein
MKLTCYILKVRNISCSTPLQADSVLLSITSSVTWSVGGVDLSMTGLHRLHLSVGAMSGPQPPCYTRIMGNGAEIFVRCGRRGEKIRGMKREM